jgi:hypothetical protein
MPQVTPLCWAGHRPDPAIRSHERRLVITFCDQSASALRAHSRAFCMRESCSTLGGKAAHISHFGIETARAA